MDRITAQMDTYSKFGLNKEQLSALREILSRKGAQKIGTAITNSLIPDDATHALFTGEKYVTPGTKDVLGAEVKNSQGFLKGRNNLIQFIDKYRTPSPSTTSVSSTAQKPKITAQEFLDNKKAKVTKQPPTPSTTSVETTQTKPATTTSTAPATPAKTISVISDPMVEKLKKIDAKNTQQRVVDGLRGTGPGVKKPSVTPPKNIMANSPRFGGVSVGGIMGNLKGGIVDLTLGSLANMVIPHISRETVRGALVLTGQDTTNFDRRNAGLPVVANLDGVSYNISTEEGLQGALEAKNKGAKPSKPSSSPNKIQRFADIRGSITPGSVQPAATNLGEGAAMDAAERFRAGAGFPAGVVRPDDYPTLLETPGDSELNNRGPSAAELFNKYKQQGLDDKTARKMAKDEGMKIWANKYKDTLAKKVKEGQAGYNVIQNTLYPNTEEGFANPNRPGVIEMIDGQRLEKPMSINEFNSTQEVNNFDLNPLGALSVLAQESPQRPLNEFNTMQEVTDFDLNPLGTLSVLAKKDPQKALNEFMTANGLIVK